MQRSAHPLDEGVELAIDGAAILGLRRLPTELDAYPGRGQLKPCGAGFALVPPHASADEYRRQAPSNERCRQERSVRVAVTTWEEIMAITPDVSAGVRSSDAAVALALAHAMLNRQGPHQQAGTLNLAISLLPESTNQTLTEARRRLQTMLAQLE
jgi:hypothetical protein